MIYKDAHAEGDSVHCPAPRDEICVNCRRGWGVHNGWACRRGMSIFNYLSENERFTTEDMLRSIGASPTPIPSAAPTLVPPAPPEAMIEASLYAFFTAPAPGCCACNIPRDSCKYHR